jgi:hypothetical protein
MILNEEILSAVADGNSLDELEEAEIIFEPLSRLGGLDKCRQLRSLSLIKNGLTCISHLEPVAATLTELCLTDQQLTRVEGLSRMPQLRRLFLHRNQIERLERLDGCPRLETLWLSSNRISVLEGLENLGCLQVLWLQDNRLKQVRNLEYLANLTTLALAGNPLKSFESIQNVACAPVLRELSFEDSFFTRCPVTDAEGYRAFLLCSVCVSHRHHRAGAYFFAWFWLVVVVGGRIGFLTLVVAKLHTTLCRLPCSLRCFSVPLEHHNRGLRFHFAVFDTECTLKC